MFFYYNNNRINIIVILLLGIKEGIMEFGSINSISEMSEEERRMLREKRVKGGYYDSQAQKFIVVCQTS